MAVNEAFLERMRERRVYLIAAILFPLIILIGFARTYYLKGLFGAPPLASIVVHLHGGIMTAWVALFVGQVFLIRTKNIRIHQTLGFAGIALAVLILISGFLTAIAAGKNGAVSFPPDIPRLAFLVVPIFDLIVFAVLFAAAVYYRKRAANHKRLMMLTAINFLPPALGRFPIAGLQSLGPLFFFGVPTVLTIIALVYDTWQNRKLNKVFLAGAIFLIASYPLRIAIAGTEPWLAFAAWLTTLSPI
jgi:hypothetical protein